MENFLKTWNVLLLMFFLQLTFCAASSHSFFVSEERKRMLVSTTILNYNCFVFDKPRTYNRYSINILCNFTELFSQQHSQAECKGCSWYVVPNFFIEHPCLYSIALQIFENEMKKSTIIFNELLGPAIEACPKRYTEVNIGDKSVKFTHFEHFYKNKVYRLVFFHELQEITDVSSVILYLKDLYSFPDIILFRINENEDIEKHQVYEIIADLLSFTLDRKLNISILFLNDLEVVEKGYLEVHRLFKHLNMNFIPEGIEFRGLSIVLYGNNI